MATTTGLQPGSRLDVRTSSGARPFPFPTADRARRAYPTRYILQEHHVKGWPQDRMNSTGFRTSVVAVVLMLAGAPSGTQLPAAAVPREDAYRANNLGVSLLEQFKFDEAAAAFREALRREPNLGIAHLNLSIALLQNADFTAARGEAEAADRLMPGAAHPPYVLALIAREENRDVDAIRFLERVRQIDPRDTGAAVNLGQIHIQNRQYTQRSPSSSRPSPTSHTV